jgi:hypothetical protein
MSPIETVVEKHFTPEALGESWGLSADTVRRVFEKEPGVLVITRERARSTRRYRTLRIPESVAVRVHRRLSNPDKAV